MFFPRRQFSSNRSIVMVPQAGSAGSSARVSDASDDGGGGVAGYGYGVGAGTGAGAGGPTVPLGSRPPVRSDGARAAGRGKGPRRAAHG